MAAGGGGGGCCPAVDLMRSEPMHLVQLIIPVESAHRTVSYLGDLGLLQFKDVISSTFIPLPSFYLFIQLYCFELITGSYNLNVGII